MTHTDITKSFSSYPNLADLVPSEHQIQSITAASELWVLVPEEDDDDLNLPRSMLYTSDPTSTPR